MGAVQKLIVVLGPTASGKTALGLQLARAFKGEIISADSRQVYRGMDIGTAKERDTGAVRQHLVDILDPDEPFSVAEWKRLALRAAEDIIARGHLPIVVGGTGLYIQSLVDNLDIPSITANQTLRASLAEKSDAELLGLLRRLDPSMLRTIDARNRRRVIRALEVMILTGETWTGKRAHGKPFFDVLQIGIDLPRRELYARIDERVRRQIDSGLVDEVRHLLKKYPSMLPSLSAIGYREIVCSLSGEITLPEAIARIQFATHAYVRRQLTWFRKDKRIKWVKTPEEAENLILTFF